MKAIFIFLLILLSSSAFADLYFTASFFQDTEAKPIVTKHHIFKNQPYVVRYWKMDYNLVLKKLDKDFIQIEHESLFTTPGKKHFLSAGIWSGKKADKMELKQYSKEGKLKFKLTLTFD